MKRLLSIIAVLVLALSANVVSAQSRNSYFMEGSYFRTDMNPALAPTRGYVALPGMSGVGVDIPSNFLSIDNFIYQKDNQMVSAFHGSVTADEFLGKLPDTGRLGVNANVNVLGVGFYAGKMYWNFGARVRSNTDVTISKDLFSALKTLGNGTYDLSNTNVSSNSYLETYVGTSFPIGKHVNLGVRAKFLVGVLNLHTEFDKVEAVVGRESVAAQLRGKVVANSIFVDQGRIRAGEAFSTDMLVFNDVSMLFNNAKSFGAALDLGLELKFCRDHLKISAAVTDLGFIKWKAMTNYSASANADLRFDGFNLQTGEANTKAEFEMFTDKPSAEDYRTALNASLNVGVEYNFLRNHFAIGLMSHTEFIGKQIYSELTASLNIRATNWISATVSHTFLANNKLGVLGAAINFHPRVLNIFIGADFIDTRYGRYGNIPVPRYQNSFNVYAGVGFNFARPKFMREAVKDVGMTKAERKAERLSKRYSAN